MNAFNQQIRCDQGQLVGCGRKCGGIITDGFNNTVRSNQTAAADLFDKTEFADFFECHVCRAFKIICFNSSAAV